MAQNQPGRHPEVDFRTAARLREIDRRLPGLRVTRTTLKWLGPFGLAVPLAHILRRMSETGSWDFPTVFAVAAALLMGGVVILNGTIRLQELILALEAERSDISDPFGWLAPPERSQDQTPPPPAGDGVA